jgi:hypothetical protein
MGVELFQVTDKQTDGQTDMTKLIVALRTRLKMHNDVYCVPGTVQISGVIDR